MARAAKTAKGLTEKQERFAVLYFRDGNASQAYREAFAPKKMSAKHIANKASALLKRGEIQGRVAELRAKVSDRAVLTLEKTFARLARIVNGDVRQLFGEKNRMLDVSDWDPDTAAIVAGVESFEEYQGKGEDRQAVGMVRKVKLIDVNPAIANAMRHFGAFEKDNKQRADPTALLLQWLNERNAASGTHGLPVNP